MATESADDVEMPRNFSWVIDDLLCACAYPGKSAHLRYLRNQGVTCIVTLTAEYDLPAEDVQDFDVVRLKMADFTPPTMEQVLEFVQVMEQAEHNKKSVAVHCAAGRGRTGTVISCYLVKKLGLTAQQAIQLVRRLRPGSVETEAQADLVEKYQFFLKDRQCGCINSAVEESSAAGLLPPGSDKYEVFLDALHTQSTETQFSRLHLGRNFDDFLGGAPSDAKEAQHSMARGENLCECFHDRLNAQSAKSQPLRQQANRDFPDVPHFLPSNSTKEISTEGKNSVSRSFGLCEPSCDDIIPHSPEMLKESEKLEGLFGELSLHSTEGQQSASCSGSNCGPYRNIPLTESKS